MREGLGAAQRVIGQRPGGVLGGESGGELSGYGCLKASKSSSGRAQGKTGIAGLCPLLRATAHSFSRILAGKSRSNFPLASRVSCSELLGATWALVAFSREVPHTHCPEFAISLD